MLVTPFGPHIFLRRTGRMMLVMLAVLLAVPAPSAGAMTASQMVHDHTAAAATSMAGPNAVSLCAAEATDHAMSHCDRNAQADHNDECCSDECDGCVCTSCLTHLSGLMMVSAGSLAHDSALKLSILNRALETRVTQVPKSPPK